MSGANTPLGAKIRAEIAASGSMGLDRYMEICLADPKHGYYAAGAPIGAGGDFTTAPEVSQIFGELIGLWLAQCWIDQGAPSPFALVELGPGRGVLMQDALRATKAAPGFLKAARLHLVETSGPLRAQQMERLAGALPNLPPRWVDRLEEVDDLPLFLVANEFFDALPIIQWARREGSWRERRVGLSGGAPCIVETQQGRRPPEQERRAPEGAIWEASPVGEAIAGEIGRRIGEHGGAALLIDYGYTHQDRETAGWRETFQAMERHKYVDPFAAPGRADLTAHVAFDDLAAAALSVFEPPRCRAYGPIGQGALLNRLGAPLRAAALAKAAPERGSEIAEALHRLTEPDAMGALFRTLAIAPVAQKPPAAFD